MEDTKQNVEALSKAKGIADIYAKSQGKESITDITEPIKENLNSSDSNLNALGRMQARGTVEQLSMLLLRQELFTVPDFEYMQVVDVFNDGEVKEGNGKQYNFKNNFGSDKYISTEFIPETYTKTSVDQFFIKMYNENAGEKELTSQGYQFRKSIIYQQDQWIPYFKMGNLVEFIAMLQKELYTSWRYFIFHKIMKRIKGEEGTAIAKQITSTADNAFDAWNDFLKAVRAMTTADIDFNYSANQDNLMSTNPSDLLVFAHPDNIQTLQSGIKTQLFNAQFLDFKGILNESNLVNVGKVLTNTEAQDKQVSVDKTTYYIPKNTIYVVSKKAIKHFSQLSEVATQFYARNLAMEFELHKWGALDFLPWGQAFVFKCDALDTTP